MMHLRIKHHLCWSASLIALTVGGTGSAKAADTAFDAIEKPYEAEIRPLVTKYCGECHSPNRAEAEIDLSGFKTFADVRRGARVWQKIGEMLDSAQMPPFEAKQPTEAERVVLKNWVRRYLKEEAKLNAGDPGPVVLRRLSNAEYTYSVRDLTRVTTLDPAKEFPADGAAGEGFTNAGNALVMSPALVAKYLDAGKDVASHAVFLPDGLRFSAKNTRRDWTEELLSEIRQLYAKYSDSAGGSQVNLQGIVFNTNGGGRLPLERYFAATLQERDALRSGKKTAAVVAQERGLSAKYLSSLWTLLTTEPAAGAKSSLLMNALRARWKAAKADEGPALAAEVAQWQQALWRFTSVGHIGKLNGPKAWMEPVTPITARQDFKFKLPPSPDGKDITLYLVTTDAGDGAAQDFAVWERPRLVAPGRPDLLIKDVRAVTNELATRRERVFATTAKCLRAVAEASALKSDVKIESLAQKHGVEADVLAAWLDYFGIGAGGPVKLGTLLTRKMESAAGYDFVKGWVADDALSIVANSSDQHVRIPGNMKGHGVAVHPSPTQQVGIGWRSPVAATIRISGTIQHAHPECGNGVVWSVELRRGNARQRLATGIAHGPTQNAVGPVEGVAVQAGDVISLVIAPRDGNHACDLTAVDLVLHDGQREWNLAQDVSPNILASNPHADRLGNADVWSFFLEPASGGNGHVIPAGSLLAKWQASANETEQQQLADATQQLLQKGLAGLPADSPDIALYRQLTSLSGPLFSAALQAVSAKVPGATAPSGMSTAGLDPALFGKHPDGSGIDAGSLCVQAPAVIEVRLPADLVQGTEFVASGLLHPATGSEGSVQMQVQTTKPAAVSGLQPTSVTETNAGGPWTSNNRGVAHGAPIIAREGSATRQRIEAEFVEFRNWFPSALCYTKIVPVDEVVTLTLFYREDDHLKRLLLSEAEAQQLDRLWRELHFVSHDALTLVDAYEQLWQYATQDADPKVFEPLRQPIMDRAKAFRQELIAAEAQQVEFVLHFAARAFRRPLKEAETQQLRRLYQTLRSEEVGHEDAVRLLLARVLVAPAFLYRAERTSYQAPPDEDVTPLSQRIPSHAISDSELATRLSYFLGSTMPDPELRALADRGGLRQEQNLSLQTRRLMRDERMRRFATEFFCQWIHIYEFDQHDEKSPATFPTFSGLRGAMYEESIRFFTDLVQRDGSVLEIFDADHTFLNEELAKHYGIPGVTGSEWRRVDGLKQRGRGGILGMATTLSKQAGASRTSPILRGNWVCEVLLGDKLPKPPKGVPQLPEVVPAGLTERQLIEKHSAVPDCAKCHARIDPIGFSLEKFDGIGRWRGDDSGVVINVRTKLNDGVEVEGLAGLRTYLLTQRRDDFVRQFCKKLLGFALGRGVQLSDDPLLDEMQSRLKANDYRISAAIDTVVSSAQFQSIRGQ